MDKKYILVAVFCLALIFGGTYSNFINSRVDGGIGEPGVDGGSGEPGVDGGGDRSIDFREDFSYPDGSLSSIWKQSVPDGLIYVSNDYVVLNPTGWSGATCIIADDQYLDLSDYAVEVTVTSPGQPIGVHAEIGIIVRWTNNGAYYVITHENNYMRFGIIEDDQYSSELFGSNTLIAGTHTIRVEVVGNSIKAWLDGVLQIDVTDDTHTHGKFGFSTFNCEASFDYVSIEPDGI